MSLFRCLTFAALVTCLGLGTLRGQEEEEKPAEVHTSGIIMAGTSDGGPVMIEMATPLTFQSFGSGGGVLASPMMFGGGVSENSVGWLSDDNILDELDIVDEQREQLKKIRDEEMRKRTEFFNTIRGMAPSKMGEFVREFGTMLKADVDKQVQQVLLPHQVKRLEQIRLQTNMRGMGTRALEAEVLVKALGITEEQKKLMREKEKEVQQELKQKLEQLRKEAQSEVLSVLTDAQREKLTGLLGEDYEFKPRQFTFPRPAPQAEPKNK
jgi:Spy/CpxP family protein refolding chaperone